MFKRFLSLTLLIPLLIVFDGWGQTNPTAQSLPFSVSFGTSTFTSMPAGTASWTGLSGASVSTQSSAESSTPTGNATLTGATAAQTGGGTYGYATSSNGRLYIQTSSNTSNGANQWAFAINTGATTAIKVDVSMELISAQPRTFGSVLQYRLSTGGSWTTVSGSGLSYKSGTTNGGDADGAGDIDSYTYTITGLTVNTDYTFRFAHWRGTETGNSSGLLYDNLSVTVAEPTTNASGIDFTNVTSSSMTLGWDNGNGAGRLVLVKQETAVDANPVDGTDYTANAFGTGSQIGTGNYAVFKGSGNSVDITGLSAGTTYHIAVFEYNGSGTAINYRTTDPGTGNQSTTTPSTDTDSDILTPVSQVTSQNIPSTADQSGEAVEIFKFRIQDKGTSDGVSTKVTNIKLIPGTSNSAAWASVIQGLLVKKDGSLVTTGTVSIANDAINIPVVSGNLDISNNFTSEITVSVYLKTSGITDNQILAFKIPQTAHGFTADETGSIFASSISGEISSNNHTITVTASKLNFVSSPSTVTLNTDFTVRVECTDDNGNRDLDALNSVTLARTGGSGTLSSATSLSASLSLGIATWSDLRYNTEELFEISATASGLVSNFVSNITCAAPVYATDLFISEYVEGSSNNKYIEIFNGTGGTIDLSNYSLKHYNNGSSTVNYSLSLSGTLDNNATIVVMNSSATALDPSINKLSTTNSVMTFNGDDAIALFKGSSMIDLFGNVGEDPGSGWTSGSHSTVDKTLRRKSSVIQGVENDPSGLGFPTLVSEWDVFNLDNLTGLGSHTFTPPVTAIGTQTVATGANTYPFTDKYLRLEFTGVTAGGTIQVAFYGTPPANATGLPGNVSQYRWVITNNGVADFTVNFRVKRSSFLGLTTATPGNSDVKLYKRETPGSGSFTDLGFMTYDSGNDEYYLSVTSFSEFIIQSPSEPLPVELTSFTASAKGTSVTLNWETKTEIDNNGFEVERNSTGTWQKIGFVEGHGTANSPKYYSYSDNNPLGNKLQYRLKQIDNDGDFEYSNVVEVELAPVSYTLYQNYPNPFNPSTVIRFAIPAAGNVTVNVFNTLGEKVATLLDGQLESGYHQVTFDAANLPSGLYFYEVQAGEFKSIKKMLLMK